MTQTQLIWPALAMNPRKTAVDTLLWAVVIWISARFLSIGSFELAISFELPVALYATGFATLFILSSKIEKNLEALPATPFALALVPLTRAAVASIVALLGAALVTAFPAFFLKVSIAATARQPAFLNVFWGHQSHYGPAGEQPDLGVAPLYYVAMVVLRLLPMAFALPWTALQFRDRQQRAGLAYVLALVGANDLQMFYASLIAGVVMELAIAKAPTLGGAADTSTIRHIPQRWLPEAAAIVRDAVDILFDTGRVFLVFGVLGSLALLAAGPLLGQSGWLMVATAAIAALKMSMFLGAFLAMRAPARGPSTAKLDRGGALPLSSLRLCLQPLANGAPALVAAAAVVALFDLPTATSCFSYFGVTTLAGVSLSWLLYSHSSPVIVLHGALIAGAGIAALQHGGAFIAMYLILSATPVIHVLRRRSS